ncbi:hypothetical protein F4553_001801 [Allocatelliglobosispora scoriae]|uniref:Uncharacterized protein n=1 Tax=Allocatelliglobosispora scoriae TaxID=643052 RepID=A0A841BNW1_9ACTN|nr:hypothetical protein [Allocatelliglobosispora scoriae]MBB5868422.1 hypothetical protein [Allocatelliglobosispora scoriae]
MGIYLVDIGPDSWAQDEITSGIRSLLDRALVERGLRPYPGPPHEVPPAESFEEKIAPVMDGFAELCARHGAEELLDAALFVPVLFDGLITLPIGNAYDDEHTRVFSSHRLRDAVVPMAAEIGLPADLPRGALALSNSIDDPVTFYVAVYRQAAEHSLRHDCPIGYI